MVGVYSLPGFITKANIQTVHMLPTNVSWAAKGAGWAAFPEGSVHSAAQSVLLGNSWWNLT